jgi:hypothetical protein
MSEREPTAPKRWVPHPFRAFCEKDGKPRASTSLVEENHPDKGPNLTLLYGLLVLALAAAIGFALLIVMPFYHRR